MLDLLPTLNTSLIVLSGLALVLGRVLIAQRRVAAHRAAMLTACGFAAAFLVVYVARWALLGTHSYPGTGTARTVYLTILAGHSVLAVALVPLVLVTLARARRGDFAAHRRIARWTFPTWLVVAASGWLVYWLLYHA